MNGFTSRWVPTTMLLLPAILGFVQIAAASTVSGRVIYRDSGRPIPGLSVYVVHPVAGRSRSVATDSQGHFLVADVPPTHDTYFIEIYWGSTLKYRKSLSVSDPNVVVADIVL